MIPRLNPEQSLPEQLQMFLEAVRSSAFSGGIAADYASRLINATDNSIYQLLPQAVLTPENHADIAIVMQLLGQERFRDVALTPRGGGTGTNGQALNHSIILDCSRNMRRIMHFDVQARQVTVEPGVILDQLNRFLRPHGLFFPPTLSPSNRATLGGMVATDACGKGSRIYGKTSHYIESLSLYLPGGEKWEMGRYPAGQQAQTLLARDDRVGKIARTLHDIATDYRDEIIDRIPELNREFSGYNLAAIYEGDSFTPTSIIAGSEGTLGVIASITLRLRPIPACRRLVALCYRDFDATLRAASHLLSFDPLAVETFDGTVFRLARGDAVWHRVQEFMPAGAQADQVGGCNLVEFVSDNAREVDDAVAALQKHPGEAFHVAVAASPEAIDSLWELRKRGVGLLGNMEGDKRPVPFAEDTAVPPEQLADYIADYRTLLDAEAVDYGMFGHVDTGCLHVRPALNLRDPKDEACIRRISDQVVALVKRYGGLMWGEHGKGFRAEFTPEFIGEELYDCLRRIKAACDPYNQLNPGKIATAAGTELALHRIDEVPLRGHFDKDIQEYAIRLFPKSVECNGNGACFNYAPEDAMCPSYKATGDRRYSPKGRAGLMREWLRQLSLAQYDFADGNGNISAQDANTDHDFSHAVYDSMKECLACKACVGQCPIKVDIPDMRARFLERYHTRYRRPLKDYLIRYSEEAGRMASRAPRLSGLLQSLLPVRLLGLSDLPTPSAPSFSHMVKGMEGIRFVDAKTSPEVMPETDGPAVMLVQDAYTSFYDASVVRDIALLLSHLGMQVNVAAFNTNGKARHVKGFLEDFRRTAGRNNAYLRHLASFDMPMIGVDASMTLTYRQEYPQMLEERGDYQVQLLQEWLAEQIASGAMEEWKQCISGSYCLFSHCTEATSLPHSPKLWQQIFAHFGLELKAVATGCCGMAGTYGHEAEHQSTSEALYRMSWAEPISRAGDKALVSGFSCRCQVKRFGGFHPQHPAQALLYALKTV